MNVRAMLLVAFDRRQCLMLSGHSGARRDRRTTAPVAFTTDVRPLLTKLGCNSGGCHGKATGQNGFKLSLLGYEPAEDYEALVREARGRRLFPAAPEKSLVLLKATGTVPHGGGRLLARDSEDYQVLRRWIAQGAPPPRAGRPGRERARRSSRGTRSCRGITACRSGCGRRSPTGRRAT